MMTGMFSRNGRCGNVRRRGVHRRADARSCPCQRRGQLRGQWQTRASSVRRPNPRIQTCWRCRCPKCCNAVCVGGKRGEMFGDVALIFGRIQNHARAVCALVIVSCVVNVLEAIRNSVVSGSMTLERFSDVRSVDVRDECTFKPGLAYGLRASVTICGPRSEPPMPILTMSVMAFICVAAPRTVAYRVAETAHLSQYAVDIRHDIVSVDDDRPIGPVAQRDMQHRPILGRVDFLSGKHCVTHCRHILLLSQGVSKAIVSVVMRFFEKSE